MLRQLRIRRFRGFEKLDAELCPISVLLGPNSSGKSSVLHAVRLACSALAWTLQQDPTPKMNGDRIVIWWDWPVREDAPFLPSMQTEELFLNKGGDSLHVWLGFDETDFINELEVSLRYGRSDALRLDVRVKSQGALDAVAGIRPKSKHLSPALARALADKAPIAVAIPAFYGVVRNEPYVNDAQLERQLGAGEQGRVVRNLIARLASLKELSDLLRVSVGAELIRSTSGQDLQTVEELTTDYRDKNGHLELSSAGTGLVALAALYSALMWYKPRVAQGRPLLFLLDEPEAHLHPKLQGETGERIADLLKSFGAQALIATHSVEMINRLGLRPDTVLLSIDRTAPQPIVRLTTENEVIERLESFCDLSPFASLNLLRSRRILFHEGKTDQSILEGCARALFANDPARLARFNQWTFVELSSETNADAKEVLKKALTPLAAVDKGGSAIRIVRVLDRDYHRTPVLGPEQGHTAIKEFDVVWSRYSIESLFLDAVCLASWLELFLAGRAGAPSRADLEQWIQDGIGAANADESLIEQAADQIFTRELRKLTVGELGSDQKLIHVRRDAEQKVKMEPHVYQNGKKRAARVLAHIRSALPMSLQNRVRGDIADIVRYAPSPSTLIAPTLIPPEIALLLQYLAS